MNEHEPEQPSTNGHQRNGGYAGQERFLLEREGGGGNWYMGKELSVGSDQPIEYLPRTIISEKEIARTTRIYVRNSRRTKGYSDIQGAIKWKYNARPGRDGLRVKQLIKIATGQPDMSDMMKRSGRVSTGRDINKQETVMKQ